MDKNLGLIFEILLYVLIFILPVFAYLIKVDGVNPLEYLKLNNNYIKNIAIGSGISIIFIILQLLQKRYSNGINMNTNIGIFWIGGILVGFLEEIPMRGFLLQKLTEKKSFWKANIIVTIIFVGLHVPKWIMTGTISIDFILKTSIVSMSFGYLFEEFKSLWIPIICHSVFDLSMLIIL